MSRRSNAREATALAWLAAAIPALAADPQRGANLLATSPAPGLLACADCHGAEPQVSNFGNIWVGSNAVVLIPRAVQANTGGMGFLGRLYSAVDILQLENSVLTKLATTGALPAANFRANATGNDSLVGSAGNDRDTVDNSADIINEASTLASEVDSVLASVSWSLEPTLEWLTLTGSTAINATGNGLANALVGNGGNNKITSGGGNDALTGGAGVDTFRFSSALSGSSNADTISDFIAGTDRIELENSVFLKLTTAGVLPSANLRASSTGTAADSTDYVLYETDTGKLFYDADVTGTGAGVLVATLPTLPVLTSAGIFVS